MQSKFVSRRAQSGQVFMFCLPLDQCLWVPWYPLRHLHYPRQDVKSCAALDCFIKPLITRFRFYIIVKSKTDLVYVTHEDEVSFTFPNYKKSGT